MALEGSQKLHLRGPVPGLYRGENQVRGTGRGERGRRRELGKITVTEVGAKTERGTGRGGGGVRTGTGKGTATRIKKGRKGEESSGIRRIMIKVEWKM